MNVLVLSLVSFGLIIIIILTIWQLIIYKVYGKEIKEYRDKIRLAAIEIDNYLISLENPAELATERCVNILTNFKTILTVNRRTIDSYFDKFNKLDRVIKRVESRIKSNETQRAEWDEELKKELGTDQFDEIRRNFKRARKAQD